MAYGLSDFHVGVGCCWAKHPCLPPLWCGKQDLVARKIVYHSHLWAVSTLSPSNLKCTLLWLSEFVVMFLPQILGLTWWPFFWGGGGLGVDPQTVLATPTFFLLISRGLPLFNLALFQAWSALHGSPSPACWHFSLCADSLSYKSCYQLILSLNPETPHCVVFGNLDLAATWKAVFFLSLSTGRQSIPAWKLLTVFCTPRTDLSLLVAFMFSLLLSVDILLRTQNIYLSFHCPLAQSGLDWIQSILFLSSPLAPSISVRLVLFGFNADELLCVPRDFCFLLSILIFFLASDYRCKSKPPSAVGLIANVKGLLSFYLPLFFKCFKSRGRRPFFQRQWGANGYIHCLILWWLFSYFFFNF